MIQYARRLNLKSFTHQERRLYDIWHAIRNRCKNPNATFYRHYGGRGISICKEWDEDFVAFARDVGLPPDDYELDRANNNGNYEPGNVRWVSRSDNIKNTRRARMITIDGVTKNMSTWCDECGVSRPAMFRRLALGWTGRKLLTGPAEKAWADKLEINGVSMTIPDWAKKIGISDVGFRMRLDRGLTGEALMAPSAKWRNNKHAHGATSPLTRPTDGPLVAQ